MERKDLRPGIKGKRNIERLEPKKVNETFVVEYPLKDFEIDIIGLLDAHRAMYTSDFIEIMKARYGKSPNHVRKSLMDLHAARFIERKTIPRVVGQGSKEPYYLLDVAGVMILAYKRGIEVADIKWRKRDNSISYEKLSHTFGLSRIRAAIEKAAVRTKAQILEYKSERQSGITFNVKRFDGTGGESQEEILFEPDTYFSLLQGDRELRNFVEYDRDTEDLGTIRKKAMTYETFKVSDRAKELYGDKFPGVIFVVDERPDRAQKGKRLQDMLNTVLEVKRDIMYAFCSKDEFLNHPFNPKIYTRI